MNHIKDEIRNTLLNKSNKINSAIIRRDKFKHGNLYKTINDTITFTNDISEQIYCILNNILDKPKCPICNSPLRFKMFKYGYSKTCNNNACIRKYNANWGSCSETKRINSKNNKETILELLSTGRYSLKNNSTILEYINKRIAETDNGRVGRFINSLNNVDLLCSILASTKRILPVKDSLDDWSERFYILYHNLNETPKCLECGTQKCLYINFIKGYQKTCSNKCVNKGYAQKCRVDAHLEDILPIIEKQNISILSKPVNGLNSGKFILNCGICNNIFDYSLHNGKWQHIYCQSCGTSRPQNELREYISTLSDNVIENDRTVLGRKELDFYIPSNNLGIELDGIYWHSELVGKKRNYHLDKTKNCQKAGIDLIHIFDSEWIHKTDIVKSILANKLGANNTNIFARKCLVREIDKKSKKKFLNTNHLQGNGKSTYQFGLYYKDELVSVMTFGKRMITNKKPEYEIIRFASKLHTNVVGGASKLLKHFEQTYKPEKLITYADRRYSSNNTFYQKLGFTFSHESKPNYWYFKGSLDLISRVSFQKHKLKSKLSNFDPTLSEWENMKNNGYNRIWDCGNYVFYKEYNT